MNVRVMLLAAVALIALLVGCVEQIDRQEGTTAAPVGLSATATSIPAVPPTPTIVPGSLFANAKQLFDQGDWLEAIDRFSDVLDDEPENGLAWFYRGRAYQADGQLPAAVTDLSQALEFSPSMSQAAYYRGQS